MVGYTEANTKRLLIHGQDIGVSHFFKLRKQMTAAMGKLKENTRIRLDLHKDTIFYAGVHWLKDK